METESTPILKNSRPGRKRTPSLWGDVLYLLCKLALIGLALAAVYFFLFGILRYHDDDMDPAVRDGDLVIYYRLDQHFKTGDLVVYRYDHQDYIGRVVAQGGDTVDIDERGLILNGSLQQEPYIYGSETEVYKNQTIFPLTVPQGQLFILADHRKAAVDSRVFGTIAADRTEGKVFMILRRRNF
ncbi:MAG: signal peptidase I [Eubacteriales bacterium]|nr:signal peptidase I [Eubacteriales bacterium]